MQILEGCLNDLESDNHVLKQENLKLKKKCEEYDFVVNQLQTENKVFSQCYFFFYF
jgi:hypothetical protein